MGKTSVSVGIAAYNEEANIKVVLNSILAQRQTNFELTEIIVVSDGSSDQTVLKIRQAGSPRIKLFAGKTRRGKAFRLRQIFGRAKGEIIVLLDADILIKSKMVIAGLIRPFNKPEVGLAAGNSRPVPGETYVQKAVNVGFKAYSSFRQNNVFACNGPCLAIRRDLAKKIVFPRGILADDHFLYFQIRAWGWQFRYVPEAKVWYHSPAKVADQIRQNSRFARARKQLTKYFIGIEKAYQVPAKHKLTAYWRLLAEDPVLGLFLWLINLAGRFSKKDRQKTGLWQSLQTTKGGFRHAEN